MERGGRAGRVAVVGGGPGGGAAALALARGGAEVDFYLPAHPGEKPCGGGMPAFLIPRLDGFDASRLPAVASRQVLFEGGRGWNLSARLAGLLVFRRRDFDAALAEAAVAAGARRVAARVERFSWDAAGLPCLSVRGEARSYDWVVAADGARGLSRRSLGLAPEGESVGLGASLSGPLEDRLILGLPDVADAYLWVFPRQGGVSVGIAYSAGALSHGAAAAHLAAFLDRHLAGGGASLSGPRYRFPIPVYGRWSLPSIRAGLARRLLLAGDAAALADPLTREGIRHAALSGQWAAECLLAGRPESYPERVGDELDGELSRARLARELFFEDPVGQWMIPLARFHPGIRRVLTDLLACRQPYTGLRRRLLEAAVGLAPAGARRSQLSREREARG